MRIQQFNLDRRDIIVVFTGYMFGAWTFYPIIERLRGHRVIVVDNIGEVHALEPSRSYVETVADVAAAVRNVTSSRFHLIGFSMGGFVAQVFADRYPERLKSLILMGTCGLPEFRRSYRNDALDVLDTLFDQSADGFFKLCTHSIFSEHYLKEDAAHTLVRTHFEQNIPDREQCRGQLLMLLDILKGSRSVSISDTPCLVLYGRDDKIVPEHWTQALAKYISPSPQFVAFPNGHMFIFEHAPAVVMVVAKWLAKVG